MGLYRNNTVLDMYLRKYDKTKQNPIRRMTSEDTRTLVDLNDLQHEFNMLMTELFTVKDVVKAMGDRRLAYVVSNLFRVINSLMKHRDKVRVVRYAWCAIRPEEDEEQGVKTFIRQSRERIRYIGETVLEENAKLTPLTEYLEVRGKTLKEDIYGFFGSRSAMYGATRGENDLMDKYVGHILTVLEESGKKTLYQERLERYVRQRDERMEAIRAEKQAEKNAVLQKALRDGMDVFRSRFNCAVFNLKDDGSIGVSLMSIEGMIRRHGRNAYVILRTSVHNGKIYFRYMKDGGNYTRSFAGAKAYRTEGEAEKERERLQKKEPWKLFEVIKISEMEESA